MSLERKTALLLQRALSSLEREATRRERDAQWRPEGQRMWEEQQVAHIREWVTRP